VSASPNPSVSVCVPAFNAAPTIKPAVESALAQTYADIEVIVVDNASTDATIDRVLEIDDPRVQVYANSHNLGVCRNFNRSLSLARGGYIKFLCADDVLYPECVEAMLEVFGTDPEVGLVFAPRDIELEDPGDSAAIGWKAKHDGGHRGFGQLEPVNDGNRLLEGWIADQFASNWIGEPTSVMMSRQCLRRIGGFNLRMHDRADMDLWVRAMLYHSVGFVDRPLSAFRVRRGSLSSFNRSTGQAWLDRVWFLEGLMSCDDARRRYPAIRWLRAKALARTARKLLRGSGAPKQGKLAGIRAYATHRATPRARRAGLHGTLDDHGPPGETVAADRATRWSKAHLAQSGRRDDHPARGPASQPSAR
jgi:glycosyltransferase involved in cell wall biosynthesis